MNRQIEDAVIRRVCQELLSTGSNVSGRALRRELISRYQVSGKTTRVFAIWRDEQKARAEKGFAARMAGPQLPEDVELMQRRLVSAEAEALDMKMRAELSEYREQAHQDHWALEVDRLREQLRGQPNYAGDVRRLQNQVMQLTVENAALKRAAHLGGGGDQQIADTDHQSSPGATIAEG